MTAFSLSKITAAFCVLGVLGVLGLPQQVLAAGTFFKCSTTNGATQYAQRPISGQKCTLIRVDGTPASARETQQKLADQRNLSRAAANSATNPAAAAAANTAATPAATATTPRPASAAECAQLAQARATLAQGGRVYETDDKGERRHLSEDDRAARLNEYQNLAKTRCS